MELMNTVSPSHQQQCKLLKGMFDKAVNMIKHGSAVWKVPDEENNDSFTFRFMVHSKSSKVPHQVELNGKTR